jgi:diguanylate cyclase (GGDEF)-like protein
MPATDEPLFSPEEIGDLPLRLDEAMQAHLAWSQRLLRCALLHEPPAEDMLQQNAYQLCDFGRWFALVAERLQKLEPDCVRRLDAAHRSMHLAVRELYLAAQGNKKAEPRWFDAFENGQSVMMKELAYLKEQFVHSRAQADPLTGLPLRHGLHTLFTVRQQDAERSGNAVFIALADADHFKKINDSYGHPVGDAALIHLTRVLKNALRTNDHLLRYGGEEFMLLFLGVNDEAAGQVAERLLQLVRNSPMTLADGQMLPLTVSIGLTRVQAQDSLESATRRADVALYQAKRSGRDRLEWAPE